MTEPELSKEEIEQLRRDAERLRKEMNRNIAARSLNWSVGSDGELIWNTYGTTEGPAPLAERLVEVWRKTDNHHHHPDGENP